MFVLHPLLCPDTLEARDYQVRLGQAAVEAPTLLVLPTGLGKTVVAILALVHFLERFPDRRALVLAPTKPLVEQHAKKLRDFLQDVTIACFTGEHGPAQRDQDWQTARVIVATPQVIENDLVRGARDLRDVAFVVFDEAHRATGNYAYVFIARRFRDAGGEHALGLTASPGADIAKIQAVLAHLGLRRIEVRTEKDPDVLPYVHEVATEWVRVRPTASMIRVVRLLLRAYQRCIVQLRRLGYLQYVRGDPSRTDLLDAARQIRSEAGGRGGKGVFEAATAQARALKIQHALELAETQGLTVLHRFLCRIQAEAEQAGGSRAARDFVRDPEFTEAFAVSRDDLEPHPKVERVARLVESQLGAGARRVLVFANFRETGDLLLQRLSSLPGCRAHRFVGHAAGPSEKGLTKRGQQAVVERFRTGDLNVLVATSVAEEGLDLPETDAVILHEPVPSGIRMIQRRGRTGRRSAGRVFVLVTEGTRDEQYYWSALRREKRMHEELTFLRQTAQRQALLPVAVEPSPRLPAVPPAAAVEMLVDVRESRGAVPKLLVERGARIKTTPLPVGDYVPGPRLLVERKTVQDFVASLRDGRLFDQAKRLSEAGRAVLLVEGDMAEITAHVSRASFAGALAALAADHGLSVLVAPDAETSADLLMALARRENASEASESPATQRFQKRRPSSEAELRYVLEGLPSVGPVLAAKLLERFGSIQGVAAADLAGLQEVDGMGPERARTVHELLHRSYVVSAVAAPQASLGPLALEASDGPAR